MRELIFGGARSGKSALAEQRAADSGLHVIYVATAQAKDAEMQRRIAHHQARRPASWGLVEAPLNLAAALRQHATEETCLLVDCLTLWLSNLLFAGEAARQAESGQPIDCRLLDGEVRMLIDALPTLPGRIILVSNEVGCGIVPMPPVSRLFTDEQGRLNQRVVTACERVTLVAGGLPLVLKQVSGDRSQETEDRGQKTGDRRQRTENNAGAKRPEIFSPLPPAGEGRKTVLLHEWKGRENPSPACGRGWPEGPGEGAAVPYQETGDRKQQTCGRSAPGF